MTTPPPLDLPLLDPQHAPAEVRAAMERGTASAGQVINMYRGMAHAPGLLDTYVEGSARFRTESGFTPTEQEVVFLTISIANECTYCVAGHSTLADRRGIDREVVDALREGRALLDPRLEALRALTLDVVFEKGWAQAGSMARFLDAGYEPQQVLYIVLAIGLKAMSNYTNHLLDTPVDDAFAARTWSGVEES